VRWSNSENIAQLPAQQLRQQRVAQGGSELPPCRFAVLCYSGRRKAQNEAESLARLQAWLETERLKTLPKPIYDGDRRALNGEGEFLGLFHRASPLWSLAVRLIHFFADRKKLFRRASFLIPSNSMGLKPGLKRWAMESDEVD
jgi:hypothetical protein